MVFGLSALMLFVGTLEDDFQDRLIGIETHYGDSEKWERSIQRANRTLDQRQKPQLVPNDGRSPDTSKNLLNSIQKETSKLKSGPGRPRGSKNVDRNLGTTYQSYMHYNTCYITSLLECLFTIMGYCEIAYSSSQGICSTIFSHFERRRSNQMQEKKLARDLKQTLIAVAKWVTEEVKLYSPGGYGNPFTVLNQILLECPQDMQALWSFHFQRKMICWNNHVQPRLRTALTMWPILYITEWMVEQAAESSLQAVLDVLMNDGAYEETDRRCYDPGCDQVLLKDSRCVVKIPNKIMFVELPQDLMSAEIDCNLILNVGGCKWTQVGRISATQRTGMHFYSHILRADVPIPGWFHYNDLDNGGRPVLISPITNGRKPLSCFVFYVKNPEIN